MALIDKIRQFLGSPRGKKIIDRGRAEIAKPENQRKLQDLLRKIRSR